MKGKDAKLFLDREKKKASKSVECLWWANARACWVMVPSTQTKYKRCQNGKFVNRGNESSKVTRKATNRKGYYKNKEMKYLPPFL